MSEDNKNGLFFSLYKLSVEELNSFGLNHDNVGNGESKESVSNSVTKVTVRKITKTDSEQVKSVGLNQTSNQSAPNSEDMTESSNNDHVDHTPDNYHQNYPNNYVENSAANGADCSAQSMGTPNVVKSRNTKIIVILVLVIAAVICVIFMVNSKSDVPSSNNDTSIHSDSYETVNSLNGSTSVSAIDSSSVSAIDYKRLDIKQPDPITQKLVFPQSEESQIKEIEINAEYEGTYAFTLTEVYNGTYFDLDLYNEYGDKCSDVTTIDYTGTNNKGVEYDGVKPGKYVLKVKYYGNGTPTCLLSIYKANKLVDISGYMDSGIITDSFSAPWMRNYYTVTVKENCTYLVTTESGEYFEIDIIDKFGNCVKSLNGLQNKTELELNSGEYTVDIHCCSTSRPYTITIVRK